MKSSNLRASLFLSIALITSNVFAQGLPACAQQCVGVTKTTCKNTDFVCACSDGDYIPRLMKCVTASCEGGPLSEAQNFLRELCAAVGSPIEDSTETTGDRLELRFPDLEDRAAGPSGFPESGIDISVSLFDSSTSFDASFTSSRTSIPTGTSRATNSPIETGPSNSNNGGGGGLSTGAKVGIGLGVPLGIIILAGLVGLGFWLGKRNRKNAAIAQQPQMAGPGPAELDSSGQVLGAEMATKSNVPEMPAAPVQGYHVPEVQQQYYPGVQQPYNPAELPERR
ncbi:uncharacterized protein BDR25DRAFT_305783 [Lindgomyces ingoldianus]|uniref:Uncharacterized protein n=1 Tax=Lindgomyces ingoldianus TaxID=673940 RepID=A0ACB6QJ58_9PLEO|nr:uncharacterized protein BDR25DRAFT_305783 [Lindgomyces ingoldianus]KAF2466935.1 hypothetical protein BDR25DRAFT_305783 [Lindgomyces ingoldianus]